MSASQASTITELRRQLAAAEERENRVREYFYPWPGHPAADHFGVVARTRNSHTWALLLELGLGHTYSWTGDSWVNRGDLAHDDIYRWSLADTEKLGPELAQQTAKEHPAAAPGAAERELADQLDDIIRKSRLAVEAFVAEPVDQILARLAVA